MTDYCISVQDLYKSFLGVFMKNFIKLIGIIALAAVIAFSFAACGGGGGDDNPTGGSGMWENTTWKEGEWQLRVKDYTTTPYTGYFYTLEKEVSAGSYSTSSTGLLEGAKTAKTLKLGSKVTIVQSEDGNTITLSGEWIEEEGCPTTMTKQ
jgi:hypothetical protein